jgi:hypothetical protein
VRAGDGDRAVAVASGVGVVGFVAGNNDGIALRVLAVGSGAGVGQRCKSVAEDVGRAVGGVGAGARRNRRVRSELGAGEGVDAVVVEVDDIVGLISGVGG